jgi:hypothetical protein
MENLSNDIQDILISQNVELEAKIGRKIHKLRLSGGGRRYFKPVLNRPSLDFTIDPSGR